MSLGTISIGTSTEGQVVICTSGDSGTTVNTMLTPAGARIYAAMMMAFADLLDPPALQESRDV
jgi:hypothetical protein